MIPRVSEKVNDKKLRYLKLKFQNLYNGKPLVNPRLGLAGSKVGGHEVDGQKSEKNENF